MGKAALDNRGRPNFGATRGKLCSMALDLWLWNVKELRQRLRGDCIFMVMSMWCSMRHYKARVGYGTGYGNQIGYRTRIRHIGSWRVLFPAHFCFSFIFLPKWLGSWRLHGSASCNFFALLYLDETESGLATKVGRHGFGRILYVWIGFQG